MQKKPAPENPFPITEDSINTAIKNAELEITLGDKNDIGNKELNSVAYFLMNKDNKAVGILSITHNESNKMISMTPLYQETTLRDIFLKEDFPKIASMITELYGGFSDNNTPYKDFSKEFDSKDMPKSTTAYWNRAYNDIIYSISLTTDGKEPIMPVPSQIEIMNTTMLKEQIVIIERNIKATEERLAEFPERNNDRAKENLAAQKERLEILKEIK